MSIEAAPREVGNLSISAEHILPIIKKWLYSDKDIFLRELVSNGVDAITKLKHLALTQGLGDLGPYAVDVKVDKDAKTLTVADNGVGMSADEVKKYINQVAFSGASEFLDHYKPGQEGQQIIGHFGLGFYSAFMVAERVELFTKSYQDAPACRWESTGGLEFTLEPTERTARGTEVVLHVGEEGAEFLEEVRVREVLRKYCQYLPVEIRLNGRQVNELAPLWTKAPASLKDEDYLDFYRKAFPFEDDPLFWIHLNVDYPFHLQGILYFPKLKHEFDLSKGQVQLYCNQVFVSDGTQEVIPRFLTVLKGMVDCPDIPLNVSRSQLQNDPYVRKIAGHITRKVADRLAQLFKADRAKFEAYWEDIHPFVKFGMIEDAKFAEACQDLVLFATTKGGHTTVPEYLERAKDRHENTVYYAEAGDAQVTYLELFKGQGLEALLTSSALDAHFIQFLESRDPKVKWRRVDADATEHLVDAEAAKGKVVDAEGKTSDDRLAALFGEALGEATEVKVQHLKATEVPGLLTEAEHARRLREMSALWQKDTDLPAVRTLVVNAANPLVQGLLTQADPARARELARHVHDLARLAAGTLKGEDLARFIARSQQLLG